MSIIMYTSRGKFSAGLTEKVTFCISPTLSFKCTDSNDTWFTSSNVSVFSSTTLQGLMVSLTSHPPSRTSSVERHLAEPTVEHQAQLEDDVIHLLHDAMLLQFRAETAKSGIACSRMQKTNCISLRWVGLTNFFEPGNSMGSFSPHAPYCSQCN